jgi:hypothetical protein
VYILLSYRIFPPYVNRQNLGSPSCYFLRIEYNSVNDMNARRRDATTRARHGDRFLVLYTVPPLCGNSNPNQLSNCFGSSLMSYSYVEEDDCIASLSLMLTPIVSAVTYIHVYMASCERWSSVTMRPNIKQSSPIQFFSFYLLMLFVFSFGVRFGYIWTLANFSSTFPFPFFLFSLFTALDGI